jgi:SAM-dependent methyltransferase
MDRVREEGAPHGRGNISLRRGGRRRSGLHLARLLDGYIAPQVARAPAVLAEAGLADRAEIIAGDFFAEIPDGDLHVLSNVLHDWEDDQAKRIVASCHRAGRPGGGLLVVGYLLPSSPGPSLAYLMDLLMMMVMGGRNARSRSSGP